MPRKHPRPAARKAMERKRAKAENPKRQTVGVIAHHGVSSAATLALLAAAFLRKDRDT
jgi:hypothetical protein